MTRALFFTTTALAFSLFVASPASAQMTKAGKSFAATQSVGGETLVLNGVGVRKATFLKVKVYAAGLYLPEKSSDAKAILNADQKWRIVMKLVRDADAESLREGFIEAFKKNGNAGLKKSITKLNTFISDMKKGDVVTITYEPGKGTKVSHKNGGGRVKGKVLGKAMLQIWLGNPPNKSLKTGMLGG